MTGAEVGILAAVAGVIVLAGFLAMAETSLTRINRVKALTLQEEGRRGAGLLARLVEHPERFLNPVLLLVLVCHVVASILVGLLFERYCAACVAVATFLEVSVIFVLAYAAPKTLAV